MDHLLNHDEEVIFMTMEIFGQWDNLSYNITSEQCGGPEWEVYDWTEFKLGDTSLN